MKVGFIGLGKMGLPMASRLQLIGNQVIAWNRSAPGKEAGLAAGLEVKDSIPELTESLLGEHKVVWLMVDALAVEDILFGEYELASLLSKGDILIDGANSNFKNSVRRAQTLSARGIGYLDIGVSGGLQGAASGPCLMVGGDAEVVARVEEFLISFAGEGGYIHTGESGSGHFTKMVHNGIEYGMMQSIAEGLNLLQNSDFANPNLSNLVTIWQQGSIIKSALLQNLISAFEHDPTLKGVSPRVGENGTVDWFLNTANDLNTPSPVIAAALYARYYSQDGQGLQFRIAQVMREQFGGHDNQTSQTK